MKNGYAPFLVILVFVGSVLGLAPVQLKHAPASSNENLGRQVYLSEGCINCHSQYIRNGTLDTEMWGPASPVPRGTNEPVLIGNRRQGPDLANIGARRSREWNRAHLIAPGELSPGSRMPGYGHLFENDRSVMGEALLDYLQSLSSGNLDSWWEQIYGWRPSVNAMEGDIERGRISFEQNCRQCHGESGKGDGPAASRLTRPPRNLVTDEFMYASEKMDPEVREMRMEQIIKYGQFGTSMPGHESLTDGEIVDLLAYLNSLKANIEAE